MWAEGQIAQRLRRRKIERRCVGEFACGYVAREDKMLDKVCRQVPEYDHSVTFESEPFVKARFAE